MNRDACVEGWRVVYPGSAAGAFDVSSSGQVWHTSGRTLYKYDDKGHIAEQSQVIGTTCASFSTISVGNSDEAILGGVLAADNNYPCDLSELGLGTVQISGDESFLLKQGAQGNVVWAAVWGSRYVRSTIVDTKLASDGTLRVLGKVSGGSDGIFKPFDLNPGTGTVNIIANYYSDLFLISLAADGSFLWGRAIVYDAHNNVGQAAMAINQDGVAYLSSEILGSCCPRQYTGYITAIGADGALIWEAEYVDQQMGQVKILPNGNAAVSAGNLVEVNAIGVVGDLVVAPGKVFSPTSDGGFWGGLTRFDSSGAIQWQGTVNHGLVNVFTPITELPGDDGVILLGVALPPYASSTSDIHPGTVEEIVPGNSVLLFSIPELP